MAGEEAVDIQVIVEKVSKQIESQISQFGKQFANAESVNDLRNNLVELKNSTEEFAGMTEQLAEKINQCIDEIRTVGGKKIRDVDPDPIKKARKKLTLLDLGRK